MSQSQEFCASQALLSSSSHHLPRLISHPRMAPTVFCSVVPRLPPCDPLAFTAPTPPDFTSGPSQ